MTLLSFPTRLPSSSYLDQRALCAVFQRVDRFVQADQQEASTVGWDVAGQHVEVVLFLQDLNS